MGLLSCCFRSSPSSPVEDVPLRPVFAPVAFGTPPEPPHRLNDLPVSSWGAVSRLSQPEDANMLRAIFDVEDRSDADSDHLAIPHKKSSSAIGAVTTKLKQRISRESGLSHRLSDRRSNSSFGHSEEERARRAELRRLRHKRIQEELSNEEVYDDDAKSVNTVNSSQSLKRAECVVEPSAQETTYVGEARKVVLHSRQPSEINVYTIPKRKSEASLRTRPRSLSVRRRRSAAELGQLLKLDQKLSEWAQSGRHPTTQTVPETTASDSGGSSFELRENLLSDVERRFSVNSNRTDREPYLSRFTEVFDDDDTTPQIKPDSRYSRFMAIQLSIGPSRISSLNLRSFDGQADYDISSPFLHPTNQVHQSENGVFGSYFSNSPNTGVNSPPSSNAACASLDTPSMGAVSPGSGPYKGCLAIMQDERATQMWGKAVRAASHQQFSTTTDSLHIPLRRSSLGDNSWKRVHQDRSKNRKTPPSMPPKSWARFPSHTREIRTGPAGRLDGVDTRDFALLESPLCSSVDNDSAASVKSESEVPEARHSFLMEQFRGNSSLPARLSRQIQRSFMQFRASKKTLGTEELHGRRTSTTLAGRMDYPELEMLPLEREGSDRLRMLQDRVEEDLRMEERRRRKGIIDIPLEDTGSLRSGMRGWLGVDGSCSLSRSDESQMFSYTRQEYDFAEDDFMK